MRAAEREPALVLGVLRDPVWLARPEAIDWERLVREARATNLLARIACDVRDAGVLARIDPAPRAHLEAALNLAAAHRSAAMRELRHVREALVEEGIDVILLKGAAYLAADLPAARGRLLSDIDILVAPEVIARAEAALMKHGWATSHRNAYDQRYYRRWMHELPPMQHVKRATVLDVHYSIAPTLSRMKVRPELLRNSAVRAGAMPGVRVLAPPDMVLHSATHLFLNDDLSNGLRDLADLDSLLRDFGRDDAFWPLLLGRSRELDLARPLFYALRYAHEMLATPVPARAVEAFAPAGPRPLVRRLMDFVYGQAFGTTAIARRQRSRRFALQCLYVRGHWLRMPPLLLAYHLTRKLIVREECF